MLISILLIAISVLWLKLETNENKFDKNGDRYDLNNIRKDSLVMLAYRECEHKIYLNNIYHEKRYDLNNEYHEERYKEMLGIVKHQIVIQDKIGRNLDRANKNVNKVFQQTSDFAKEADGLKKNNHDH